MKKKLTKGRIAALLLLGALAVAATSWAAVTSATAVAVVAPAGDPAFRGNPVRVIPMEATFTVTRGAAQVIAGVELFKVQVSDKQFSNTLRLEVVLRNPQDIGGVLSNPNSYIDVAVWYPYSDPPESPEHRLSAGAGSIPVYKDPDDRAAARMSVVVATAFLRPSLAFQDTFYILATIVVPGGGPPGTQEDLMSLDFWCGVR